MSHNILITGGSGYLGGSLLARLGSAELPPFGKLYASVRTEKQAEAVKQYDAEPLLFDLSDANEVRSTLVSKRITIVYFLVNAMKGDDQVHFIEALAEVKKIVGFDVHFLHTTGAKIFSSHAGAPTDRPLLDTDPKLYDIQKSQRSFPLMQSAVNANNTVIETAEKFGVRSYIFAPCIVYGKGEGFGNKISIQTVAIVKAAKALQRVYNPEDGKNTWPVCHVIDNSTLYIELLRDILSGRNPGFGKNGYYLASPGSVAWIDIYTAFATALAKRNVVTDDTVEKADDEVLERMGNALGCPKERVIVHLGGLCTFTAEHGEAIGWKPQFLPEHIIEAADEEVEHILNNLD